MPGRVRVSVRLRPRNSEELRNDADFADYVELMPEVVSFLMHTCESLKSSFHVM